MPVVTYNGENASYEDMIKYYGNLLGKIEPADPDYKEKATDAESQEYLNKLNATKNELAKYTNGTIIRSLREIYERMNYGRFIEDENNNVSYEIDHP